MFGGVFDMLLGFYHPFLKKGGYVSLLILFFLGKGWRRGTEKDIHGGCSFPTASIRDFPGGRIKAQI